MRNKVKVVTGYVPLKVKHMAPAAYREHQSALVDAVGGDNIRVFDQFPYEACWLAQHNPPMVGANARAPDRFDTDEEHARSNVVCSQFVEWAATAVSEDPTIDVVVSLTSTVLKQGDFTNKRVEAHHIQAFLDKVARYDFQDIPFPGITKNRGIINAVGDNWRFCGSTHIWPAKWLERIRCTYKFEALRFIRHVGKTPLDLAIWPAVEITSLLPFRWYQAEYDYTQFTNFPEPPQEPPHASDRPD